MNVFSPDTLVELARPPQRPWGSERPRAHGRRGHKGALSIDNITLPAEIEAGEKTGEGPLMPEQRRQLQQDSEGGGAGSGEQRRIQQGAEDAGGDKQGANQEPTSLGPLSKVSPVAMKLVAASWGLDLHDVEIIEDASLRARGVRGAVSDATTVRLAPGQSADIELLLEELCHIAQFRNAQSGELAENAPRDPGGLEAEAQKAVEAALEGKRFEIEGGASSELRDTGVAAPEGARGSGTWQSESSGEVLVPGQGWLDDSQLADYIDGLSDEERAAFEQDRDTGQLRVQFEVRPGKFVPLEQLSTALDKLSVEEQDAFWSRRRASLGRIERLLETRSWQRTLDTVASPVVATSRHLSAEQFGEAQRLVSDGQRKSAVGYVIDSMGARLLHRSDEQQSGELIELGDGEYRRASTCHYASDELVEVLTLLGIAAETETAQPAGIESPFVLGGSLSHTYVVFEAAEGDWWAILHGDDVVAENRQASSGAVKKGKSILVPALQASEHWANVRERSAQIAARKRDELSGANPTTMEQVHAANARDEVKTHDELADAVVRYPVLSGDAYDLNREYEDSVFLSHLELSAEAILKAAPDKLAADLYHTHKPAKRNPLGTLSEFFTGEHVGFSAAMRTLTHGDKVRRQRLLDAAGVESKNVFKGDERLALSVVLALLTLWQGEQHGSLAAEP